MAVLDAAHLRVNVYDEGGTYEREFKLPGAVASFAVLDTDHIVIPDPSGRHAFQVIDPSGKALSLGDSLVPPPGQSDLQAGTRNRLGGRGHLIAVAHQHVIVADNFSGALWIYRPDGTWISELSPPPDILQPMFEHIRKVDAGFGVPVASFIYKDMTTLDDGRIALLTSTPGMEILLVDPDQGSLTVLRAPEGPSGDEVRRAASVSFAGPRVAFVGMNGLSFYRVGG